MSVPPAAGNGSMSTDILEDVCIEFSNGNAGS